MTKKPQFTAGRVQLKLYKDHPKKFNLIEKMRETFFLLWNLFMEPHKNIVKQSMKYQNSFYFKNWFHQQCELKTPNESATKVPKNP